MLYSVARVNGRAIMGIQVERIEHTPYSMPDSVFNYRWEVQRHHKGALKTATGVIQHRYGDGPELLLSKILATAAPVINEQLELDLERENARL